MKFIKSVWDRLKEPKSWVLAIFCILFAVTIAGTITLLVVLKKQGVWHYILYGLSAIELTYFAYTIIYLAPKAKVAIVNKLRQYRFTSEILDNYGYRTMIFSIFSFILNIGYIVFMGVLALKTMSAWYISITAYYLCLGLMKGNVFYSKRKYNTPIKEARAYRYAGMIFIFLTIALSGIVVLIYTSNMYFEYAGLMIYVVAVFTFYKLVLSIVNIFKARKQENLYVQTIRNINLASSLVSIVVLQVAMLQAFSPASNTSIANALTGGGVSLVILTLGIFMIVKANKRLKELENKNGK